MSEKKGVASTVTIHEACDNLVEQGLASRVSASTIQFTGDVDLKKLSELERSYAEAFHRRLVERISKEREAEKEFHDFVITY